MLPWHRQHEIVFASARLLSFRLFEVLGIHAWHAANTWSRPLVGIVGRLVDISYVRSLALRQPQEAIVRGQQLLSEALLGLVVDGFIGWNTPGHEKLRGILITSLQIDIGHCDQLA